MDWPTAFVVCVALVVGGGVSTSALTAFTAAQRRKMAEIQHAIVQRGLTEQREAVGQLLEASRDLQATLERAQKGPATIIPIDGGRK